MNERELLQLKKEIDEAKQKTSELKGERQALMKQLKEEWNCETIEQAQSKITEMSEQSTQLSNEIDMRLIKLDEAINSCKKEFDYLLGIYQSEK